MMNVEGLAIVFGVVYGRMDTVIVSERLVQFLIEKYLSVEDNMAQIPAAAPWGAMLCSFTNPCSASDCNEK